MRRKKKRTWKVTIWSIDDDSFFQAKNKFAFIWYKYAEILKNDQ